MKRTAFSPLSQIGGGWFILAAAFLFGTTGTAQAFAPPGAQPMTIGTIRLAVGALALLLLTAVRGELRFLRSWRSWPFLATLAAAAGVAAFQIFFFAAVARTGVAVGTIVALGTTPIAAGSLAIIVHRQWPGRHWMVATALAIAGCALLILATGNIRTDMIGILFAIIAGIAYALFALFSKDLLAEFPVGSVLTVTFMIGVMMLLPVLFLGDLSWLLEPRGLAVALHLGVVTVGFAYLLFAIGLAAVPVATAATLNLAEPLTAGLLGVLLLGERLNTSAAIGVALLLAGLLSLALQRNGSRTIPVTEYSDSEGQLPHP